MTEQNLPIHIRTVDFIKSATRPQHFPEPDLPEVAFAGRSNVGKSSLINAMVGRRQLVKVSGTPGRTQLINFFQVNESLSLVDLPGYGFARVPDGVKRSWGKMIEAYLAQRPSLVAVVVIMDLRRGIQEDDLQLIEALPHYGIQPVLVFTKADKFKNNARMTRRRQIAKQNGMNTNELVLVSSLKRTGLDRLWMRIRNLCGIDAQGNLIVSDLPQGEEE